ncbi:hypothetical protein EV421DRAFT_1741917 [Armillaria borealis]|uniref:Uncharacterized protein n=1 Tax=Armillaria borealis TaxID=47425 RepID=A0AA39MGS4_9AGAR|nr:hypothetical protein EV421DRAFT_1741917 [Armillaria borealis]
MRIPPELTDFIINQVHDDVPRYPHVRSSPAIFTLEHVSTPSAKSPSAIPPGPIHPKGPLSYTQDMASTRMVAGRDEPLTFSYGRPHGKQWVCRDTALAELLGSLPNLEGFTAGALGWRSLERIPTQVASFENSLLRKPITTFISIRFQVSSPSLACLPSSNPVLRCHHTRAESGRFRGDIEPGLKRLVLRKCYRGQMELLRELVSLSTASLEYLHVDDSELPEDFHDIKTLSLGPSLTAVMRWWLDILVGSTGPASHIAEIVINLGRVNDANGSTIIRQALARSHLRIFKSGRLINLRSY